MGKQTDITQADIAECVKYDPATGKLTWLVAHQKVKIGDEAGHLRDDGYVDISIKGTLFLAHRVIWCLVYGYWPEHEVDHLNRIRDDNRIENLEHKTQSCNLRNGSVRRDSKTGIPGVHYSHKLDKYIVRITVGPKRIYVCTVNTLVEAARARHAAEIKHGYKSCIYGESAAEKFLSGVVE